MPGIWGAWTLGRLMQRPTVFSRPPLSLPPITFQRVGWRREVAVNASHSPGAPQPRLLHNLTDRSPTALPRGAAGAPSSQG